MTNTVSLERKYTEALDVLTSKQQAFVREYLVTLNASDAARKAGYSAKTAAAIGNENIKKPEIQYAIDIGKLIRAEKTETSAQWVIRELAKNHYMATERGELAHSNRALELIGKHHKTFTDRVEIFDPDRLDDDEIDTRLAEIEAQLAEIEAGADRSEAGEGAPGSDEERTEAD